MITLRAAVTLGLAVVTLAGLPARAQDWQGPASLALRVTNDDGDSVSGAQVLARLSEGDPDSGPATVATSASGSVVISGLVEGEWFVEVSHPGYMLYAAYVNLRAGKKPQVGFSSQVNTETSWAPMRVKFSKASPAFNRGSGTTRRAEPKPPSVVREAPEPQPVAPPEVVRTEPQQRQPEPSPPAPPPVAEPVEVVEVEPETVDAATPEPVEIESTAPVEASPTTVSPNPSPPTEAPPSVPETPKGPVVEAAPAEVPEPDASTPEPVAAEALPDESPPSEEPMRAPSLPETTPPPPAPIPQPAIEDLPDPVEEPASTVETPDRTLSEGADPAPVADQRVAAPPSPLEAAVPAPSARSIPRYLRSAASGSCSECQAGEWAVASEQPAARSASTTVPGDCSDEQLETARQAARRLADESSPRLDDYAGPLLTATFRIAPGDARSLLMELLGPLTDPESHCQMTGVVLPQGATYSGYVLEAWDSLGGRTCRSDVSCAVGKARWLAEPIVIEGTERVVVVDIFKNRSTRRERRARMTVYFQPPTADWLPASR